MDELVTQILDAVTATPEGVLYATIRENTAPEKRFLLHNVRTQMKAAGQIHETVRVVDGVVVHTVFAGPAPVEA